MRVRLRQRAAKLWVLGQLLVCCCQAESTVGAPPTGEPPPAAGAPSAVPEPPATGGAWPAPPAMPQPVTPSPAVPNPAHVPQPITPARPRAPLVDAAAWQPLGPEEDPFRDRPETVVCTSPMVESLSGEIVFSVDTADCNYITVTQPALRDVAVDDRIKIRLWHFELSAAEAAEAHAALLVEGVTIFDEAIPIPSPSGLITREFVALAPIAEGAPVIFHLHNHGDNSWALVEVSGGP